MDECDILVDSNVLLYAFNFRSPRCAVTRGILDQLAAQGHRLWISGQCIREFCAVVSRTDWLPQPLDPFTISAYASRLLTDFRLAAESETALRLMLEMIEAHGVQGRKVFDLHLVATMRANGIRRLLTNNAADFKNYLAYIDVLDLDPKL